MIVAFLESIKYVGHLLPLVFLRVFIGYYYLIQAVHNYRGDFLTRPRIAEQLAEFLPASQAPAWYKIFVATYMVPHWQTTAFIVTGIQFAIAFSFLAGYLVRPISLLGALLCLHMHFAGPANQGELYITFMGIFLTMAWIGAGRCVGLDYYFYKRQRGIWW